MNNAINRMLQLGSRISNHALDGLENVLTGLGVSGKDKRLGAKITRTRMTWRECELWHDNSDISHKIVNLLPEKATNKWIKHTINNEDDSVDIINKITEEEERLKVKKTFKKAGQWGRLYGGAVIFISVDDGLELNEPLNPERIIRINNLIILHRWELSRSTVNADLDSSNFGMPETYRLSGRFGVNADIHHSRLLRFDGSQLSCEEFINNDYWNDPVLLKIRDIIRDYDSAYYSIMHTLQDFDVDVLKMKDLAEICASDEEDKLGARLRLLNLSKSITGSVLIDADAESYDKLTRAVSGLDKILDKIDKRLQLASGLPHTILFGEGATGNMSGEGESEDKQLSEAVSIYQEANLTDNLNRFYEILLMTKQGPTSGEIPEGYSWVYNPLFEESQKRIIENRKMQAEMDKIYIEMGVISELDVTKSRFGGEEYSFETMVDIGAIKEQEEANKLNPEEANKIIKGEEDE